VLTEVTTWHLEMLDPSQLRSVVAPSECARVQRAEIPLPELNRFLYVTVGDGWYWYERLAWDAERWRAFVNRPEVETWVLYVSGTPAGYVELEAQPEGNIEVAYFGLIPRFIGQRLGGYLLSAGVQRAWDLGARRVWVHTCSLDGPHALPNYLARGFRVYDQKTEPIELPV
jgi:GNAT superfamily N-acetyltransferase